MKGAYHFSTGPKETKRKQNERAPTMKIKIKIPETKCPECQSVLSWDAVGDITDRKVVITGWCKTCHEHVDVEVNR